MKLNETQKIIVTAFVVVAIVGSLGALNYIKYTERSELLAQLDNLKKEEDEAKGRIAQIPELRKNRADLANIIDEYANILPQEEHVQHEAFAEIIDNYRRETLVVIQDVEYLQSQDSEEESIESNFLRHRYRISLIGAFPDFLRFINKIENHTRFLKIDEFNIKPLGAPPESRGLSEKNEAALLDRAKVPFKEIEVIVSTYTYKKDEDPEVGN